MARAIVADKNYELAEYKNPDIGAVPNVPHAMHPELAT